MLFRSLNRVRKGMAPSLHAVILTPAQFSWVNTEDPNHAKTLAMRERQDANWLACASIARQALAWELADNTGYADHYLNVELTRKIHGGSLPTWAEEGIRNGKVTKKIGNHTFLRLRS